MFYPKYADPSQMYDTRFILNAGEIHVAKRFRSFPTYRDHVVIAESWQRVEDHWLLRYPSVPNSAPQIRELLQSLQFMVKSKIVHGHLNVASLRGGRIADFAGALDMAGAVTHAKDYFFPEGPPDRRVLGLVVQDLLTSATLAEIGSLEYARFLELPRDEAILELLRGWKTWDLYDLSGLVWHPLAEQCRSVNVKDRPTIAECLAYINQPIPGGFGGLT